jgi:proteasome activator subunit 2 (PA28 beta)
MDKKSPGSPDPKLKKHLKKSVKIIFDSFGAKAEKLLFEVMPQKVAHLDQLYKKSPVVCPEKLVKVEGGAKCNSEVKKFMRVLKREIFELLDLLNTMRMWVQLNIPEISDGNNFGVNVQEDIVSMLKSGRASAMSVLDTTVRYFATRAKLLSKSVKYPLLEDYKRSVEELDSKEWMMLRNCCLDLRNNYAILYDLITKNLEKIRKPRGEGNHQSLY